MFLRDMGPVAIRNTEGALGEHHGSDHTCSDILTTVWLLADF